MVMRRSMLEVQVDILKALAQGKPLKLTHIMYKANANCSILKQYLGLLVKDNLVEKHTLQKKRVVYAVTGKGKRVLRYFREVNSALQITDEAQKVPLGPH